MFKHATWFLFALLLILPGCTAPAVVEDVESDELEIPERLNIVAATAYREIDRVETMDLLSDANGENTMILWVSTGCSGCHDWTEKIADEMRNGNISNDTRIVTIHRYPSFESREDVIEVYASSNSSTESLWPVLIPFEGQPAIDVDKNKETEIVSIPGLRGRDPKEISLKTLSKIINARVIEIIEQCYLEIKNYGHEDQKKKLIAGIVLTGGGSQLKHLKQLVEYITGMDTRVGYPNEHLAGDSDEATTSPTFSTAVGLLMAALDKMPVEAIEKQEDESLTEEENTTPEDLQPKISKSRNSIFEQWTDKFKEFLDKA